VDKGNSFTRLNSTRWCLVRPPKVPIGIFTLKNRTIGPVARLFVDYGREVARPL